MESSIIVLFLDDVKKPIKMTTTKTSARKEEKKKSKIEEQKPNYVSMLECTACNYFQCFGPRTNNGTTAGKLSLSHINTLAA